jgi:hypothetical protein
MSNFLMGIWNFFDGKKRTIAILYWSIVVPALVIIWPDHIPAVIAKTSAITGLILSALGLGHAAVKASASKQLTSETKDGE